MIFVTVGTQLPFDRLVKAMDRWAADHPDQKVIVQSAEGGYQPQHMHCEPYMAPERYAEVLARCSQVVAHAGTGSILSAQESGKPLLIMPRDPILGEVRSDHQHSTAEKHARRAGILIAWETENLAAQLDALLTMVLDEDLAKVGEIEAQGLNTAIAEFVGQAPLRVKGAPCRRVLCACSTGGHFVEMLRMLSALEGHELIVMTSDSGDAYSVPASRHLAIREASRWSKSKGFTTFLQLMFLIPRLRADVVLSTGAAPGFLVVMMGRLTGSRVIWVDSLANVDRVSLGGRLARVFANLFLVQWPDLADGRRVQYRGRVR